MRELTKEEFLKDVAGHEMKVMLDQVFHRHVRFRRPNTSNMWFDLITWPGYLTIAGDMGTWTFARLEDMFSFFRDSDLRINPYYWSEKLEHGAFCGREGGKVFDRDVFDKRLLDQLTVYYGFEGEELSRITQAVRDDVLWSEDWHEVVIALRNFEFIREDGDSFHFDLMEVPESKVYSYHLIWCCYAIVWGINQWDQRKNTAAA